MLLRAGQYLAAALVLSYGIVVAASIWSPLSFRSFDLPEWSTLGYVVVFTESYGPKQTVSDGPCAAGRRELRRLRFDRVAAYAGWPFRCAAADWPSSNDVASPSWRYGLLFKGGPRWMHAQPNRRIPIRPMWLGLAADLAFYAALLAVLHQSLLHAHAFCRRRKQLCVHCGYPAHRTQCTECGRLVIGC